MKFFLPVALCLVATHTFAQIDRNPDNLRSKIFELEVKTVPGNGLKLPFGSIKVIDGRFDTSILGFRRTLFGFGKIKLTPTVEQGIENFYNEYYKNNFTQNGKVLLISIKRLWINNEPDKQSKYRSKTMDEISRQDIYARFEYFYGGDNIYSPVKRTDTVFQLTAKVNAREFDVRDESKLPFLCFALEKMIENMNYDLYLKDIDKRKKMTVDDIEKYNEGAKNIAILKEPVKKGVFVTFDEFKNNQPSITSFTRKKVKNNLYEIVDDKQNIIFKYFAYYDGENLAITKHLSSLFDNMSKDNYTMFRVNNTFQFFQEYTNSYPSTTIIATDNYNIPITTTSNKKFLVPRQIDMETGEVY